MDVHNSCCSMINATLGSSSNALHIKLTHLPSFVNLLKLDLKPTWTCQKLDTLRAPPGGELASRLAL